MSTSVTTIRHMDSQQERKLEKRGRNEDQGDGGNLKRTRSQRERSWGALEFSYQPVATSGGTKKREERTGTSEKARNDSCTQNAAEMSAAKPRNRRGCKRGAAQRAPNTGEKKHPPSVLETLENCGKQGKSSRKERIQKNVQKKRKKEQMQTRKRKGGAASPLTPMGRWKPGDHNLKKPRE